MRIIKSVTVKNAEGNDCNVPAEPMPEAGTYVSILFDGKKYIVYEKGDDLPTTKK